MDEAIPSLGIRYASLFQTQRGGEKILELKNPLHFESAYYPVGNDVFEGILPSFLMSLFGTFTNPFLVQNILILISFFLSAISMYHLVFYLTQDTFAAFISGLYFSFSPFHIMNIDTYPVFSIEWIPFFILFFLKSIENPYSWKYSASAGLFFTLSSLSSWYFGVFEAIFLFLYLIYNFKSFRKIFVPYLRIGFISIFLLMPFIMLIVEAPSVFERATVYKAGSADLLSFFIPARNHLLLSGYFKKIYSSFMGNITLNSNYLTYSAIILSIISFKKEKRYFCFFMLSFVIFFIFALGPYLLIGGKTPLSSEGHHVVKLPYYILYHLFPIPLKFTRATARFSIMAIISLGVLLSFGISYLRKNPAKTKLVILYLLSFFIIFEILPSPLKPLFPSKVPEFYKNLDKEEGDFSILELPLMPNGYIVLYYSMHHHKKVMGGAGDRSFNIFSKEIARFPFLHQLRYLPDREKVPFYYEDVLVFDSKKASASVASYFNMKYAVLHKHNIHILSYGDYFVDDKNFPEFKELLEEAGWKIVYEDEFIYVFSPPQEKPMPFVVIGNGWSDVQTYDKTKPIRWMKGEAELRIVSEEDKEITLSFMMKSSRRSPLKLYLNNKELKEIVVEPFPESFSINLSVSKGVNILSLKGDKELPYGIAEVFLSVVGKNE
jgi:hypothetical protein